MEQMQVNIMSGDKKYVVVNGILLSVQNHQFCSKCGPDLAQQLQAIAVANVQT